MRFHQICSIFRKNDSFLGFRMIIEDLVMIVTLLGENSELFELRFDSIQSYRFVPDDLAKLPPDIELDAFQRALEKSWIDDLRVPSEVHRKYLEGHDLYVLHATDVGLLEVVAVSAQLKELGNPNQ
jgi:hypothetical protein